MITWLASFLPQLLCLLAFELAYPSSEGVSLQPVLGNAGKGQSYHHVYFKKIEC